MTTSDPPDAPDGKPGLFLLSFLAFGIFQVARIFHPLPYQWYFLDYEGRLISIAVLFLDRHFRRSVLQFRRVSPGELSLGFDWAAIIILSHLLANVLLHDASFLPSFRFDHAPALVGDPWLFDITFGLALVALHEELLFRCYLRRIFPASAAMNWRFVAASTITFGLLHWPHGISSVLAGAVFGFTASLAYCRLKLLTPIILAHYLMDFLYAYFLPF